MKTIGFALFLAVLTACHSKSLPDDDASVVSVYTTQPSASGSNELDVYQQIANNLAERISTPFYRFFGYERNKTQDHTTKKPWERIELLDDNDDEKTRRSNSKDRDTEELSVEALSKPKEKPEKITLYNSYLPTNEHIEANNTINEVNIDTDEDDDFDDITLDDVTETSREGPFIFIIEWIASIIQLAWGAFAAIFPSASSAGANKPETQK